MYESSSFTGSFTFLVITIAFIILIFFLGRAIALWYWKIDERLNVMREQVNQTKRIEDVLILQTMLLQMTTDNNLGRNKRIAVKNKTSGEVKFLTLAQWANTYKSYMAGYDFEIVDPSAG